MRNILIGLVLVVVVIGGGYYVVTSQAPAPAVTEVVSDTTGAPPQTDTGATGPAASTLPAATASFDDFSAAMDADIAAQQSAVTSADQSASAAVSSANTVTTSGQPYDPSSI